MLVFFQKLLSSFFFLTKGENHFNKDNLTTCIVRSTSLGDFTVALPFIASVVKESKNIKFLLISKVGNVGEYILPQWKENTIVVKPSLFSFLSKREGNIKFNQDDTSFYKALIAIQSGIIPFKKLKYIISIFSVLGINTKIIGLNGHPQLRTRHQCEAEPDAMSVNVALAPFLACGVIPQANRSDCQLLLGITEEENSKVSQLLNSFNINSTGNPGIIFYVHAKDERKRWPIDRFVCVANEIIKQYDHKILLIGGLEDKCMAEKFAKQLPHGKAIVLAGLLSVRQTFALLSRCTLFVGNDGAPTHMAAIQGCYCVTIYCNWEVQGFWEPIVAPASISLRPIWDNAERSKGNFGIKNIPVDSVLSATRHFLDSPSIEKVHRIDYYDADYSCVHSRIIEDRVLVEY